ncbi:MAG: hypothetical protein MUP67_00610 [Acidimicrobiia bacterium]|nr:hypothetical protein [Acidimicrobiia bacterium]
MNTPVAVAPSTGFLARLVASITGDPAGPAGSLRHHHLGSSRTPWGNAHRFDGERAFVARGGAWLSGIRAGWATAELAVDSVSVRLRSRPGGLFDDLAIERGAVQSIECRRGEFGNGIAFRQATARDADRASEVVFWPADSAAVLDALRRRGWPVDAAA